MHSSSPSRDDVDNPGRQLLSDARRHSVSSYKDHVVDSPSQQLYRERLDMQRNLNREFVSQLDQAAAEREREHREALAIAAAEHERIRQSAERERVLHELELKKERLKQEEEERRAVERAEQEARAQEESDRQRQLEAIRRREEAEKRAAADRKALAEAEARLKAQKQQQEAEEAKLKAQQDEADRKAREAAAAAAAAATVVPSNSAQSTQASRPLTQQASSAGSVSKPVVNSTRPLVATTSQGLRSATSSQREAAHQRYIELHKQLKSLRKFMVTQSKQLPQLKSRIGDMRREIRTKVGQITVNTENNKDKIKRLKDLMAEALQFSEPSVDIRKFIVSTTLPEITDSEAQVPGLLIYLLNIFSKVIISQFISEVSAKTKIADSIGLVAAIIFSDPTFKWQNISLVDILLAKIHVTCPVLFGIYGKETTEGGRKRLGWMRDETGRWASAEAHGQRMTGLGAGFAALTLRDFSRAKTPNPLPNVHYWQALSYIINTPPQDVTETHYIVLKALVENYIERFIKLFGGAAIIALRKALVEFPSKAPGSVSAGAVATLPQIIKRDIHLTL